MEKIIKNNLYIIEGLPGRWKSFFVSYFASNYRLIFSNLEIKHNGRIVSNPIKWIADVQKIGFHDEKGLIIIEEAGVNASSRRFFSKENAAFSRLGMLGRKKNKDIIFIAQITRTIDNNIRELAIYKFTMNSYYIGHNRLMFEFTVKDRNDNILWTKEIDLTQWAEDWGWSYSTLEDSIILEDE